MMRFLRLQALTVLMFAGAAAHADGGFRNTYYYSVSEKVYAGLPADAEIRDMNDTVLARVSTRFKKAVDIEGTGKLLNGKVINFIGRKDGENRYIFTAQGFGFGAGNCPLVPFHTIAVDPQTLPLGAVVRIDETVGMVLPDGTVHDGIWRAEDVGSAIKGDRIDLFVGEGDQGQVLDRANITNLMPLTVRVIEPPAADSCVHARPAAR